MARFYAFDFAHRIRLGAPPALKFFSAAFPWFSHSPRSIMVHLSAHQLGTFKAWSTQKSVTTVSTNGFFEAASRASACSAKVDFPASLRLKLLHGHVASVRIPTENPVLDSVSIVSIQFGYLQLTAPKVCQTGHAEACRLGMQLETLLRTKLKCLKIWKVIGQIATTSTHCGPESNGFIEKGAGTHSFQVYKLPVRGFLQHSCATLIYIL